MSWKYLFDGEHAHIHREVSQVQQQADFAADFASDIQARLTRELARSNERVARLELTVEALIRVLELRTGMRREELGLMVQRIDLLDGVEDGRIGPDVSKQAPSCTCCGRPVNPRREACIYCGAAVEVAGAAAAAPVPVRMVSCVSCSAEVPERETWFSERGVVCDTCHQG